MRSELKLKTIRSFDNDVKKRILISDTGSYTFEFKGTSWQTL